MSHASVTEPPTAAVTPFAPQSGQSAAPSARLSVDQLRAGLPVAAVVIACAWWLLLAPRLFGGRGAGAITGGAVLTAVAVVFVAPHRYLPAGAIWLALSVSVGALVVAVTSPTGWAGVGTAATYVCMSWTVIAVAAAVVRDGRVASLLVFVVVAGALIEVAESWLAWWGSQDAATPMIGTFYWHNQFAIFLLAGGVLGLTTWLQRTRIVAGFGLLACALSTIGVVYSTSRASDAVFAVAAAIVALGSVVALRGRGLVRLVIAAAVTTFSVWAISGPPFFPHRSLPFAGTAARASGQSLGQNGGYRIEFWRESIGVFERHPLVGGGYHSMIAESVGHVPNGWVFSPFAHNGFLQALADGGLVLGVPFLLACVGVMWLVLAALVRALSTRDFTATSLAVPLCLGALLAHSAVDFDWSYAADFAVVAVLAGLVAGERWARTGDRRDAAVGSRTSRAGRLTAGAALVGVVLTGFAGVAAHAGDLQERLPISAARNATP